MKKGQSCFQNSPTFQSYLRHQGLQPTTCYLLTLGLSWAWQSKGYVEWVPVSWINSQQQTREWFSSRAREIAGTGDWVRVSHGRTESCRRRTVRRNPETKAALLSLKHQRTHPYQNRLFPSSTNARILLNMKRGGARWSIWEPWDSTWWEPRALSALHCLPTFTSARWRVHSKDKTSSLLAWNRTCRVAPARSHESDPLYTLKEAG